MSAFPCQWLHRRIRPIATFFSLNRHLPTIRISPTLTVVVYYSTTRRDRRFDTLPLDQPCSRPANRQQFSTWQVSGLLDRGTLLLLSYRVTPVHRSARFAVMRPAR